MERRYFPRTVASTSAAASAMTQQRHLANNSTSNSHVGVSAFGGRNAQKACSWLATSELNVENVLDMDCW